MKIRKGSFVVRDREHPFAEDLITNEAGDVDPHLPVLTKLSCLVDALRMGGSYELVEKLWAQFVLTAGPVNTEVAWTRDEIMVGSVNFRNNFISFPGYFVVFLLVHHLNWKATPTSHAWLVGLRLTICTVWSSRSVVWHCGPSCERGKRTLSVGFPWPLQTASPVMPHTMCQCLGQLWLLWVVQRPLLLFLVGRMCWPTLTASIREVGTVTSC